MARVLVVEDSAETILLYEKYLAGAGFQAIPARSLREARTALGSIVPAEEIGEIILKIAVFESLSLGGAPFLVTTAGFPVGNVALRDLEPK